MRRSRRAPLLLLAGLPLLCGLLITPAGCQTTTSDDDIVALDFRRVQQLLEEEGERIVLLDVRSASRFERGHIPGAINIPLPELQRRDARLADADRIIVYGRDGHSGLGAAATKRLIELRYRDVYHFRGGLATWQAQGGQVVTADRPNAGDDQADQSEGQRDQ